MPEILRHSKNNILKTVIVSSATILGASPVIADININGFANITIGKTQGGGSLLRYDDELTMSNDSLMALQFTKDFDSKLSATVQAIAKGESNWETEFSWAYLSYQYSDKLRLLFGRQRIPFYMFSDFIDVGYSYHWVTPPNRIYNAPLDTVNGFGAIYTHSIGSNISEWHLTIGESKSGPNDTSTFEYPDLINLSWKMEFEKVSTRINYGRSRQTFEIEFLNQVADTIRTVGPQEGLTEAQIDNILIETLSDHSVDDDDTIEFLIAGINYSYNNWLVVSEFSKLKFNNNIFGEYINNWYASIGYTIGDFMPYITYDDGNAKSINTDFTNVLFESGNPQLAFAGVAINSVAAGTEREQKNTEIGFRWDMHPSTAMKVSAIHNKRENATGGGFTDQYLFRLGMSLVF